MIAGGTGITPIYQLMQAIHLNESDNTRVNLVYANHTVDDILLRTELDELAKCEKFTVWYTVSKRPERGEWKYGVGRVNEQTMREHLLPPTDDTIVMLCGPPALVEHACIPTLQKIGFANDQIFEF